MCSPSPIRHIEAGEVISSDGSTPNLRNASIIIDASGIIEWVGPTADIPSPHRGKRPDLEASVVMPGMIDAHVHLAFDGQADPVENFMASTPQQRHQQMLRSASALLNVGVTTARDLGSGMDELDLFRSTSKKSRRGSLNLLASGPPITTPDGHLWYMGGGVSDIHQAEQYIDTLAASKQVDWIKVMVTGGFTTKGTTPGQTQFSHDFLNTIAIRSRAHSLRIAGHAHGTTGIAQAAQCRFDSIEHCSFITEDGLPDFSPTIAYEIKRLGIIVSPTQNQLALERIRTKSAIADHIGAVIRELDRRGVPFAIGTDAGIAGLSHGKYLGGLLALQEFGISSTRLVHSATHGTAAALGIDRTTGAIATGLRADLLLLNGSPERDLETLESPQAVVSQGWLVTSA